MLMTYCLGGLGDPVIGRWNWAVRSHSGKACRRYSFRHWCQPGSTAALPALPCLALVSLSLTNRLHYLPRSFYLSLTRPPPVLRHLNSPRVTTSPPPLLHLAYLFLPSPRGSPSFILFGPVSRLPFILAACLARPFSSYDHGRRLGGSVHQYNRRPGRACGSIPPDHGW
jgi:hypothetical protein